MRSKSAETWEVNVVHLNVIRHISLLNPLSGKRPERARITPRIHFVTSVIESIKLNLFLNNRAGILMRLTVARGLPRVSAIGLVAGIRRF